MKTCPTASTSCNHAARSHIPVQHVRTNHSRLPTVMGSNACPQNLQAVHQLRAIIVAQCGTKFSSTTIVTADAVQSTCAAKHQQLQRNTAASHHAGGIVLTPPSTLLQVHAAQSAAGRTTQKQQPHVLTPLGASRPGQITLCEKEGPAHQRLPAVMGCLAGHPHPQTTATTQNPTRPNN